VHYSLSSLPICSVSASLEASKKQKKPKRRTGTDRLQKWVLTTNHRFFFWKVSFIGELGHKISGTAPDPMKAHSFFLAANLASAKWHQREHNKHQQICPTQMESEMREFHHLVMLPCLLSIKQTHKNLCTPYFEFNVFSTTFSSLFYIFCSYFEHMNEWVPTGWYRIWNLSPANWLIIK
jgi:hypothetical protein